MYKVVRFNIYYFIEKLVAYYLSIKLSDLKSVF
ncbi:hypothetical protein BN8_06382 [Fibrisoma limi BUZ 3]|uniref:Uncharacterized protein n=1 Tax=Fibrisoma limi BUZ 3 TaxID=1185876 RepID=I2GSV9_9BACT|nr:hypothetical protein BN8_06382 [Fibrisoma limi BUZ 3]